MPKEPSVFELNAILNDPDRLKEIRSRLSDISWWMRLLCQHVGQKANRETGESGKFWESRFRAVRLLDESAVLSAVAYVDLNPIHAGLAKTIEESDFTSAKQRLEALLLSSASNTNAPPRNEANKCRTANTALTPIQIDELRDAPGHAPELLKAVAAIRVS